MATGGVSKPSRWFSNRNLRLSFPRRRSKSSSPTLICSPKSSPRTPIRTSTREDELKEVFRRFDGDGDGKISAFELRAYFGSIGEHISHEDAQAVIDEVDKDGDKLLGFEDFLGLMSREGSDEDDLRRAFEMFEMEKGSGSITPKGLQRMLHRLGDTKSYDECVAMIQVYDIDGNGVLDFHEFHQMMA